MARKKMRRFADGGQAGDIVVLGNPSFDLAKTTGARGTPEVGPTTGGGSSGGGSSGGARDQRLRPLTPVSSAPRDRLAVSPAVISQEPSTLGNLAGDRGATAYGATASIPFRKGGKADAHEPTGGKKRNMAKKYATGGKVSSASKRADGCATKGKTRGKMV